jgi:hypothetical protein
VFVFPSDLFFLLEKCFWGKTQHHIAFADLLEPLTGKTSMITPMHCPELCNEAVHRCSR